jgi:hypothetical protein
MSLIICGHERSGTTLLRNLCNAHPEISITMEFGNFLHLGKSIEDYVKYIEQRQKSNRHRSFLVQGKNENRWAERFKSKRFVKRYLNEVKSMGRIQIGSEEVEISLKKIFSTSKIVGDKYPHYIQHLAELIKYSALKIIVIYRDPRAVVSSTLKKARGDWKEMSFVKNLDTAEKIAKRWADSIIQMEVFKDKIHIIRYEQLIHAPDSEIEKLATLLGVEKSGFPLKMIGDRGADKYKEYLTCKELNSIFDITLKLLKKYEYV